MGAPVTLLLVVGLSGGEVRSGQLSATLNAQLDGARVQVQLRRADGVPDLDRALELASSNGPVAVVTNPRTGQLTIRVALQPGKWVSRTFTFSRRDPLTERNRTVALAIAAMVPEWRLPKPLPEPAPAPEPAPMSVAPLVEAETFNPPQSERQAPLDVVDGGAGTASTDPALSTGHTGSDPIATAAEADAGTPPPEDAGSQTAVAAADPDAGALPQIVDPLPTPTGPGGLGFELGALAGFWPLQPGLQLGAEYCSTHLCGGLRLLGQRGDLPQAEATVWRAGGLVVGRAQTTLGWERLRGAIVASAGPVWVMAERHGQTQEKWMLAAGLEAEVSVQAFSWGWVFLRGGLGLVSGDTPVTVNDSKLTHLPVASAQGSLGLRLGR